MNSWRNVGPLQSEYRAIHVPLAYFIVIFLAMRVLTFFVAHSWSRRGHRCSGLSSTGIRVLLFLSAVGMRLWAEERRVGTIEVAADYAHHRWQALLANSLASGCSWACLVLTFPV